MNDGGEVEMSKRTTMYTCGTLPHPVLFFSDEAYPSLLAPEIQDKIKVLKVACGDSHTIAIAEYNAKRMVYSWGQGESYRLGHNDTENQPYPRKIKALESVKRPPEDISCGVKHSAMITSNGIVYTWGENESGQCGHMPFGGATLNTLKKKLNEFVDEADRPENKGNPAKDPATKICAEVTDTEPIKVPTKVEFPVEIKKKMDLAKYLEMLMPVSTASIDMRLEALNFIDTHSGAGGAGAGTPKKGSSEDMRDGAETARSYKSGSQLDQHRLSTKSALKSEVQALFPLFLDCPNKHMHACMLHS
jgi:hypothetical protein